MKQIIFRFAITITLAGILTDLASAQITFKKTYENIDYASIVRPTADGGCILLSSDNNPTNPNNLLLIKLSANGDTLWTKIMGGLMNDNAWDIHQTDDGGFIIAASSWQPTGNAMLFMRTDSIGNVIWNKFIDIPDGILGSVPEIIYASAIQTFDGSYLCSYFVYDIGSSSVFYFKTDANGDTLWTRWGVCNNIIKQTADSGFISAWGALRKINQFGNIDWVKSYNTSFDYDVITNGSQTADGGFILCGYIGNDGYPKKAILIRTNEFGDTLWTHAYDPLFGTSSCPINIFNSVRQASDGGFIACAHDLVVKTDSMGIPLWSKSYSVGSLYTDISSIQKANNGEYMLSGRASDSLVGNWRFCLIKTDSILNSGCNVSGCLPSLINYQPAVYSGGPSNPNSASFSFASYPIITSSWDSIFDINTLCFSLGVENNDINSKLLIYPNPSEGSVNIQLTNTGNDDLIISVIDLLGRNVFESVFKNPDELFMRSIDLSSLSKGIYVLKVESKNLCHAEKLSIK